MQEQNEMEETLRGVCAQRDRAFRALAKMVDRFWAAHYNHAFAADDPADKKDNEGKTILHRCSAGKCYMDIFHGCDSFDKEGVCKEYDCPMGFHHRLFYKATLAAHEVLEEGLAEKKHFDLNRIPRFDLTKSYKVTPEWFARMELMFLNSFKIGEAYDEKQSEAYGDALSSLISIGLSSLGYQVPFDIKDIRGIDDENDQRMVSLKKNMEQFKAKYGDKLDAIQDIKIEERDKMLSEDSEFAMACLVDELCCFMFEYAFGHEYPGADCGVYNDIVAVRKHDCLVVMGIERNQFDIIKNVNDAALDADGFKVEDL